MMSNEQIREYTGNVDDDDRIVTFLYLLMRDHIPVGEVQSIIDDICENSSMFCNGYLAQIAQMYSKELRRNN